MRCLLYVCVCGVCVCVSSCESAIISKVAVMIAYSIAFSYVGDLQVAKASLQRITTYVSFSLQLKFSTEIEYTTNNSSLYSV